MQQYLQTLPTEVIILAGGLGTRLKSTVPDLPKCMAPVAGRPFLFYVINYLRKQGINRFIFSLGYKHEVITSWLEEQFSSLDYTTVIEPEPLGTGGAIQLACKACAAANVLVVNGDTFFDAGIAAAAQQHANTGADCTILLKQMKDFDRYGVVETGRHGNVTAFVEKKYQQAGNINAGAYFLNVSRFLEEDFDTKFSFETDYLEKFVNARKFYGYTHDGYFIDIGIPEDYFRAQEDFSLPPLQLEKVDSSWTLFIDRDGVINYEKKEDYIRNIEEFRFYEGVPDAFRKLAAKVGKIIIVSNQRGVGRELMTLADLESIQRHMRSEIEKAGGRIDEMYFCTAVDNKDPRRKPNPGMAFEAMKKWSDISPSRSIMIGNKRSDMQFGRNAGMYTVFVATTNPEVPFPHPDIDMRFNSLPELAKAL